jgi:hypothetical protein
MQNLHMRLIIWKWARHTARMKDMSSVYTILLGKRDGEIQFGNSWIDNINNKKWTLYIYIYIYSMWQWWVDTSDSGSSSVAGSWVHSNARTSYRVLTMLYNTQNHWVFGFYPSSGIPKTRKHNVSETASVSILRWGGRHLFCEVGC